MLEVINLTKSYGDKKVLENLNCKIKTNSIYGLVGANGAGKSTLLRIINNILASDTGNVMIEGIEIKDNEKIKQNMVFVPDDLYFFSSYTLKDTAIFYKSMYKKFDMKIVEEMASLLKLDINKKIKNFSKGMKRQCALICALATNANYMFFDETFDGLDPIVRNIIKDILKKQMAKKETTIIMTSHNLRELEDICDNLGLLYKGGILFESEINTLKTGIVKVQIASKEKIEKDKLSKLEVMSFKELGSVQTIIVKGKKEEVEEKLNEILNENNIIIDFLPLTLEEMFIYEMEVLGYAIKQII